MVPASAKDKAQDTATMVISSQAGSTTLEITTEVKLFRSNLALASSSTEARYQQEIEALRWLVRRVARSLAWHN